MGIAAQIAVRTEEVLALLRVKGFGPAKVNKLLQQLAGSSSGIIDFLAEKHRDEFLENIQTSEEIISNADKGGFKVISITDSKYPQKIIQFLNTQAPPLLFYKGNIQLWNNFTAGFCGSRAASEKGIDVAIDISMQLVAMKKVVVSGYASGIDMTTHIAALSNCGNTIIVLPEGVNSFRIKTDIKEFWDWERTLVISEFLPDDKWSISRAMQRNNTIIALSDVMFLIEAKENGGSIDAGRKTLKFGKPLFTPVYEGMPESARGNQMLLNQGARPVKRSANTGKANLVSLSI